MRYTITDTAGNSITDDRTLKGRRVAITFRSGYRLAGTVTRIRQTPHVSTEYTVLPLTSKVRQHVDSDEIASIVVL